MHSPHIFHTKRIGKDPFALATVLECLVRFFSPESAEDAIHLKGEWGGDAQILAGGTDLLIRLRNQDLVPGALLSMGHMAWNEIRRDARNTFFIGAMATAADLALMIREACPLLAISAAQVGGAQIRNMATLGGNVANASPAADMALCLYLLEANVVLVSSQGERCVGIDEFMVGPGKTILSPEELIRGFNFTTPPHNSIHWFRKVGPRSRHFISRVAVGGLAQVQNRTVTDIRIGLGSVAPTPIRAMAAEDFLRSADKFGEKEIEEASSIAAGRDCSPIDDVRASAGYRRDVIRNLVRQFLRQVAGNGVHVS